MRVWPLMKGLVRDFIWALRWPWRRLHFWMVESHRMRELERTILVVKRTHDQYVKHGFTNHATIHNVALFLLLFERDIAYLKRDAVLALTNRRRQHIARQLSVQLYECSEDMPQLLGKEFRESLVALGAGDAEFKALKKVTKKLSAFKRTHHEALKEIRNVSGAHRDHRAAHQMRVIEDVDLVEVLRISGDLYEPIREFMPFLTALVSASGNMGVLVGELVRNPAVSIANGDE